MTNPSEIYADFMKSSEAADLFNKINFYDFLFEDINKIKEALHIKHIELPYDHLNHIAYLINTMSIGMIPESKYSPIPDELKPNVINFFKVLIELDSEYEENSIGEFIKKNILTV